MIETRFHEANGIQSIIWNTPGPLNVKSAAAIHQFAEAVSAALADDRVRGIIITSAKKDFISGGDLEELRRIRDTGAAIALVAEIGTCLRQLETGGKPVVAAINGSALGGGFEVALACHYRIAVDDAQLRIGLPEASIGLMPGAGATQRLPRLIGIAAAAPFLLEGKVLRADAALKAGFVDQLVKPDELVDAATDWLLGQPQAVQPWDRKGYTIPGGDPQSVQVRNFFMQSWPKLRRKTSVKDTAAGAILQALHHGCERDIDAGLRIEQRHFAAVVVSPSAKAKIRTLFYSINAARRLKTRPQGIAVFSPRRIAVIGAGLMGAGIAHTAARSGLEVILVDSDQERAENGKTAIAKNTEKAVERGLLSPTERTALLERITAVGDIEHIAGCDAVIEAVVERADVKERVLRQVLAILGDQVFFASNTSTLPISGLAEKSPRPDAVIGMHFFAPVDRMPLLEIIAGGKTSDETIAKALDLARILGKTPIVVGDGRGFYTSRVVGAYTREALLLLQEGISPPLVDNIAMNAGMPIGPLAMADQTALDLLHDILGSLAAGREGDDEFVRSLEVLDRMANQLGRPGRKKNAGIYDYAPTGEKTLWPGLEQQYPAPDTALDNQDIQRRLFHIQVLETMRSMDEGVLKNAVDADVASITGWAFPAHLGGVLSYADQIGIKQFVLECDVLAQRYGDRFHPPESLRLMARENRSFYEV
jgi:3-hydroxyacyl-CoA dehydrogenase / enoyl-CoA hydratase / 3-hydroxybutyryl-CoA epimerase